MKRALLLLILLCLPGNSFAISSDQALVDKIESSLDSIELGLHDFEISSRFGKVSLKGYVSSMADRDRVETFVSKIDGVNDLNSHLEVRDSRASARINSDSSQCPTFSIPPLKEKGSVTFFCQDDTITVNGVVGSSADRIRLHDAIAASVPNAKIVMNAEIADRPSDDLLQRSLDIALAREGRISDNVTYFVKDGVAYFRGSVSHHTEIDAMLATANMIEGLKDVRSEVRVGE